MKRSEIMYGVKYIGAPGYIALFAYKQDAIIKLADAGRRIRPVRVVVTYEDGTRPKKRATPGGKERGAT